MGNKKKEKAKDGVNYTNVCPKSITFEHKGLEDFCLMLATRDAKQ